MLKDKKPERILLNRDFLDRALENDKQIVDKQIEFISNRNTATTLLLSTAASITSLAQSWNQSKAWKYFFLIITFIFAIGFIFCCIRSWVARKDYKTLKGITLSDKIYQRVENETRYTALLIICFQDTKTGMMRYLTEKTGNYIAHCKMDPSTDASGQKEEIIHYLINTYNINKDHFLDVIPLSDELFYSIKPIHDEVIINGFVFYQIRLRKKAKQNLANHKDVTWMTVEDMKKSPELMGINKDVVTAIEENARYISDSFDDQYGPLHIIWNITNSCNYDCAICATYSRDRKELSLSDKLTVLEHIQDFKKNIAMLDFAGGDPLTSGECHRVVKQAIHSLGEEHVSITTTGFGVEKLESESRASFLTRCEVTIDASHENLSSDISSVFARKESSYNVKNIDQVNLAAESLNMLILNIPIIDDDLSDDEIDTLIDKILNLKKQNSGLTLKAQIIRLMPVGHFSETYSKRDYLKYNPTGVAVRINNRINQIGIACRFHCSLRVLPRMQDKCGYCNMLEEKIGIDCSGNVFACAWAAYLPLLGKSVENNPFYLGNLVESDLRSIIEGKGKGKEHYIRIKKKMIRRSELKYCSVVSWYIDPSFDDNNDPLSS